MPPPGFEPGSPARKASMIDRTTPKGHFLNDRKFPFKCCDNFPVKGRLGNTYKASILDINMPIKENLFNEIVKKGYQEVNGNKVYDLSNREFLYLNEDLARSFLAARAHPRYKEIIVNKELELIKDHVNETLGEEMNEEAFNLIDIGCGDGTKAKAFLEALKTDQKVKFCPTNVNEYLVNLAMENVKGAGFENVVGYKGVVSGFDCTDEVSSEIRSSDFRRNVLLLLGSVLASYDINDYLFNLTQAMLPGDYLIIGNGIRKGERFGNVDNYKHPGFNKWFGHLMTGIGFEEDEVEYDARFANDRVEGFYKVKKDKEIEHEGKKIEFKQGDEIVVAGLHKYYETELEKFCKMYFSEVKLYKDKDEEYSLVFCKK
tara:strand:+ start:771 stop:1889 length:1119 start_codon:yes stop_codon:yes gene_type:complete